MTTLIEERSRITAKGQTTVPKSVRQALGVDCGGEIAFLVNEHGVRVVRADDEADPVIGHFLDFLARDMQRDPGARIVAFPPDLAARMKALTSGIAADPDAEIDGPVAL